MANVSIVIPAWNRAAHIESAIRSILNQTYRDFEIIVVDDASKDRTSDVVARLASCEPCIRLIRHEAQQGAQAARNTGIQTAAGRWVAFLDSDDEWMRDSLEKRLSLVQRTGRSVVHSECVVLPPNGQPSRLFGVPALSGSVWKKLLAAPGPMFQGLLVERAALVKIGGLDNSVEAYQEWDTSIRLARLYEFDFVDEPTFIYDCRHPVTISKDALRSAKGYEQVVRKHAKSILLRAGPTAMANHYRLLVRLYGETAALNDVKRCRAIYRVSSFLGGRGFQAIWKKCMQPRRETVFLF